MHHLLRNLTVYGLSAGLISLLIVVGRAQAPRDAQAPSPSTASSPELAYLKQVNQSRPADPQLHLLLMGQFANAGRHLEGIAYFEQALKRFGPQSSDNQKA